MKNTLVALLVAAAASLTACSTAPKHCPSGAGYSCGSQTTACAAGAKKDCADKKKCCAKKQKCDSSKKCSSKKKCCASKKKSS